MWFYRCEGKFHFESWQFQLVRITSHYNEIVRVEQQSKLTRTVSISVDLELHREKENENITL